MHVTLPVVGLCPQQKRLHTGLKPAHARLQQCSSSMLCLLARRLLAGVSVVVLALPDTCSATKNLHGCDEALAACNGRCCGRCCVTIILVALLLALVVVLVVLLLLLELVA